MILDAPTGSEIEVAPALDLAAEWRRLDPYWSGELSEIETRIAQEISDSL